MLPRGTGHLLVEAEERTYKSSVIFEWSVSHSSVGLIATGGERPLVVRAAVEGLAVAGRWPVIWRTVVGDEERRGVSSLDVPLAVREAQEPSIPLDRRRPPEALYEEEALPGGGVLLRYVGGWSGRWHTPAFSQFAVWGFLVGVALTVFGFWAAALPIVPLLLLGPLTTPDIEVDRAGVTLRRRWGRFVLRTRRWLASRIESLYIDTLPGTRVVAVGDRFYQPLAHGKSADEVEWLRAVILRTLLGGERQERAASATAVVEEDDERFGPCPACAAPALEHVGGELDEHRCPFCAGRFLPQEGTERLVEGELGVTRDMLRELARYFGGERRTCPSCRSSTSAVRLKGVTADLCQGCGGLWLDPGELAQLSAGRYEG